MPERWRVTPRYKGYEVSDQGRVRSLRRPVPKVLQPRPNSKGYLCVHLATLPIGQGKRGVQRSELVHALVLEAFREARPAGSQARHLNGNQTDNRLLNLTWGTPQEQCQDKKRHGTHPFGERCGRAKLTAHDVAAIRNRLSCGNVSLAALARVYGVSPTSIRDIKYGLTWNHDAPTSIAQRRQALQYKER